MTRSPIIESILKSKCAHLNQHLKEETAIAPKKQKIKRRAGKEVQQMNLQLYAWCKDKGFLLLTEVHLHPVRKYRLDYSITKGVTEEQVRKFEYTKENMIAAIEYQGGIFMEKSGHSKPKGATRDCDKSNLAQSLGWTLLTFTAINCKNVIQELEKLL